MRKLISQSAFLAAASMLALPVFALSATEKTPESGRWVTESGNLVVDISPCGQALCGTVVKVIANRSMSKQDGAMTSADGSSPLGLKILTNFAPSGEGEWKGRIYNRENGKTYDGIISLAAPDQLKVHGYKVLPIFGKTQIWRRVAAEGAK